MLIRFRVSNFRSLRDEQELSMVAAFRDGRDNLVALEGLDADLLRVAGIYGANAAGKSNVLEALKFMRDAVSESHRTWPPEGPIPREPFLLDQASSEEPSSFEADFLLDGVRFQYGFKLDSEKILEEWLFSYPNRRRQIWFTREASATEPFSFGRQLKGRNRTIESLTRANSLFLSAAAGNAHEALLGVYSWFSSNLVFGNPARQGYWTLSTVRMLENKPSEVIEFIRAADLGINNIKLGKKPVRDRKGRTLESNWAEGANSVLEFQHQTKGSPVSLALSEESRGTQAWFSLAGPVLGILDRGGVLCIDELDSSLHPLLAIELIRIFQDPKRNPKNAQLIFNTHDTNLLSSPSEAPLLYRDQIWFVEKDDEGATHLYPLTDFKPRKFENLERGYLQGRYGAIPFIEPIPVTEDA
ncbi:MAG TPA: AAA family ATPase [Thermoanaerobaculia bacterium]|nr:AAA family ATPase [Thermoanaerobaculia bacterium]